MFTVFRKRLAVGVIATLSIVGALLAPTAAQATVYGHYLTVGYGFGQAGEETNLINEDYCPDPGPGNTTTLHMEFVDADNNVFEKDFITGIENGQWSAQTLILPSGAALGTGELRITCIDDSTSTVSMRYDTSPYTIVGDATSFAVDHTAAWGTMHVSASSSSCTNNTVVVEINEARMPDGSMAQGAITQSVGTGPSGAWAVAFNQQPDWFWHEGDYYSVKAYCGSDFWTRTPFNGTKVFRLKSDQYVALGDSYSSGEGSFNYDLASGTGCDRSTDSYAYYLVDNKPLDLPNFAACAGDVTDDYFNDSTRTSEDAQRNHLSSDAEVVTMTFGGNDVGFVGVAAACADYTLHSGWSCSTNTTLTSQLSARMDKLAGVTGATATNPDGGTIHSLKSLLVNAGLTSPSAKIYIAGYPHLFGDTSSGFTVDASAPGSYKCVATSGTGPVVTYSLWDAQWLNDQADALDTIISDAVDDANTALGKTNIVYVPPTLFNGHGLCDTSTAWINGVHVNGSLSGATSESMHPTITGMHDGYGAAFLAAMS